MIILTAYRLVATIRDAEVVEGFGDDDGFEVVGDVPNPTSMFDALFAQVGGGPQVIRRSLAGKTICYRHYRVLLIAYRCRRAGGVGPRPTVGSQRS